MVLFFCKKTGQCIFCTYLWAFLCVLCFIFAGCSSHNYTAISSDQYKSIGEKIRIERIKKGLTQEQLATAVGLSQNSLSLIEDGLATPIKHKIFKIEDYLEIELLTQEFLK